MSNIKQDPVEFARRYAKVYGIPPQLENETDFVFRSRVADTLRGENKLIEANEAYHNKRYEDSPDVLTGVFGALSQMLFGATDVDNVGKSQIETDFAAGIIARKPKKQTNSGLSINPAFGRENRDARSLVLELMQSTRGVEIAKVLLEADFTIEEACEAFESLTYVVGIEIITSDTASLHVSNAPIPESFVSSIQESDPRVHPSIMWKK